MSIPRQITVPERRTSEAKALSAGIPNLAKQLAKEC